jgi:hypothetical protein
VSRSGTGRSRTHRETELFETPRPGGDLVIGETSCAQFASLGSHVVFRVRASGPVRRGRVFESVVKGGIAHRAEDLFDLAEGFAGETQFDSSFA